MELCAKELNENAEEAMGLKRQMDEVFEGLATSLNAESGKALIAAYESKVADINLFAELLNSEAEDIRHNINAARSTDEQLASVIRSCFYI